MKKIILLTLLIIAFGSINECFAVSLKITRYVGGYQDGCEWTSIYSAKDANGNYYDVIVTHTMAPCPGFTGKATVTVRLLDVKYVRSLSQLISGTNEDLSNPVKLTVNEDYSIMTLTLDHYKSNLLMKVDLFNVEAGQNFKLFNGSFNGLEQDFLIGNLPSGCYITRINLNDNVIAKKLLIIR